MVKIPVKLANELIETLDAAQLDFYVQSTENIINELKMYISKYERDKNCEHDFKVTGLGNDYLCCKKCGYTDIATNL